MSARSDQYTILRGALVVLGHERPEIVIFRAQRIAGDIARAEAAGNEPGPTLREEASQIAGYLPAVWEFATASHAGGGG